jgi:hypothetical protein
MVGGLIGLPFIHTLSSVVTLLLLPTIYYLVNKFCRICKATSAKHVGWEPFFTLIGILVAGELYFAHIVTSPLYVFPAYLGLIVAVLNHSGRYIGPIMEKSVKRSLAASAAKKLERKVARC